MPEDAYLIEGGKTLKGKVRLSGAKNVALKTIIAALLFKGPVYLKNIPRIRDVDELLFLIANIGGKAKFVDKNTLLIDGQNIYSSRLNFLFAAKVRVSFMFFAPLLYKFKKAFIPNPGGCRLGARSIDRVIEGMRVLGITVEYDSTTGYYQATLVHPVKGTIEFSKPTHTGTELIIMISVLGNNKVTIKNAALEPEIDDLINFFNQAGANISRSGNKVEIIGVKTLRQKSPYTISSDRNEAVTFISLALSTQGEIIVGDIPEVSIKAFIEKIKQAKGTVEQILNGQWLFRAPSTGLQSVSIETAPHPGFMTDWQPLWAVLMTQARGQAVIHERLFENRFSYVDELNKLGADISYLDLDIADPKDYYLFNYDSSKKYRQAIAITGPQRLHSGVLNIADLRAGATLAIAALMAPGESIVSGVSILERGYENFVEKVRRLGGNIKKI